MLILGISAFYHDSAAAIVEDGNILTAVQEERFTRIKHDASFPVQSIKYCLAETGTNIDDFDAIVFYDKPFLKFERLLETYNAFAPKGIRSFIASMPVWLKEKMFLKKLIYDNLNEIEPYQKKQTTLLFPEHHLSHASSAFYPSPFEESAILTLDGVGEWATTSISYGKGKDITILKEMRFPHSIGLLYSAFTYFLGFKVNSGEYKLMGLAPYGNPLDDETKKFVEIIHNKLVTVYDDGSIWLNQDYFNYATGLRMVPDKKWQSLFGIRKRQSESELTQQHCNLAYAIQHVTEEIVIKLAKHAKKITNSSNLCLAGGVALNCVANGVLEQENIFESIYIQPAAGDAGGALGAALAGYHIFYEKERPIITGDAMKGAYLGPDFSDKDVTTTLKKYGAVSNQLTENELCQYVAQQLAKDKVVGWFQGKMEFGPRALGNRSILANPQSEETQKKVNLKIKYRESFRPFAPSVLFEDSTKYFDMHTDSPFMLKVFPVQESKRLPEPSNYNILPLKEKLYHQRSEIPAVTHVDYSARIQTVHKEVNPKYHKLITEFKKVTNCGMLVNTSFNVRGEPIVCTPTDAYKCFMRTEMDVLVINNFVFLKEDQPQWEEKDQWEEEFKLD